MTAEIINLKRVRKQRARADKTAAAAQNRFVFGRTKAEREILAAEAERAAAALDGLKLDSPNDLVPSEQGLAHAPAANQGSFPSTADHEDDGLDPGTVS